MKLSETQRQILERALAGEDRQLPQEFHPGPPSCVLPARRWVVPPGNVLPSGSGEYSACRALARRGLLLPGVAGFGSGLPYGRGGFSLTPRGLRVASRLNRPTSTPGDRT